ncbi:MAG: hypothetical protein AAFR46_21350 [Pseudomonadota bacterium]
MALDTLITFQTDRFKPTPGELDEEADHEDWINPGRFAKEAADFMAAPLNDHGYRVANNFAEDWGRWVEIEHDGGYFLPVGLQNLTTEPPLQWLATITPDTPTLRPARKLFRKISVEDRVIALRDAVFDILQAADGIEEATLKGPDDAL